MIVVADFQPRYGWALKDPKSGVMHLCELSEDADSAHALLREMRVRQPHRGKWIAVPVEIIIREVDLSTTVPAHG